MDLLFFNSIEEAINHLLSSDNEFQCFVFTNMEYQDIFDNGYKRYIRFVKEKQYLKLAGVEANNPVVIIENYKIIDDILAASIKQYFSGANSTLIIIMK